MALHIFEDRFSGHGTALLWPFTNKRFGGDGHQPAKRQGTRRPRSGYQKAKARALRPADRRPPARPGPSKPMCPDCWVKECDRCKDRGCGCPERGPDVHQLRPKRRTPAEASELPETPPF
jgi:hypothetical protein